MNITHVPLGDLDCWLEPMTGQGITRLPHLAGDVPNPFDGPMQFTHLNDAAIDRAFKFVGETYGYWIIEDQDAVIEGCDSEGRECWALEGPSVIERPSLEQIIEAMTELRRLAGL